MWLCTLASAGVDTPGRSTAGPRNTITVPPGALTDPVAWMRIRRGQAAVAVTRLRDELLKDPSNLDLEVLLGVALADDGNIAEAYTAFLAGRSAATYDSTAIGRHADVLRIVGAPGDAARLRTETLWVGDASLRDVGVFLDLVDDFRADGDLDSAWNAAMMALTLAPDRAAPYAQLAEVLMDLDRWDEAREWLYAADAMGPTSAYLARASARSLVHEGRTDEARAVALEARREDRSDLPLRALQAYVLIAAGESASALDLLSLKRFDHTLDPQMLLASMHALEANGRLDELEDRRSDFCSLYARPVLNGLEVLERPQGCARP
jgi:Flp pilus assembly protein TadD